MEDQTDTISTALAVGVMYFLPALIALGRRHHNRAQILLVNLFFGWTVIGWIAAVIWASGVVKPAPDRA